jgi:hypothetical protein
MQSPHLFGNRSRILRKRFKGTEGASKTHFYFAWSLRVRRWIKLENLRLFVNVATIM